MNTGAVGTKLSASTLVLPSTVPAVETTTSESLVVIRNAYTQTSSQSSVANGQSSQTKSLL